MKSQEFRKIINNSYKEERQAIYEKLKQVLDIPDDDLSAAAESQSVAPAEIRNAVSPSAAANQAAKPAVKPKNKRRTSFKNFFKKPARLAACVSAAVAVACLAIILPFALNRNDLPAATPPSTSDNPSVSEDRFCAAATCKEIELKYSLKEYSASNKLSLLYVDWYDVADIKTSLYVNKEDSTDIIYYQEILEHKYTGSIVELYITDNYTKVDKVNEYKKFCKNVYIGKYPYYLTAVWGFDTDENGEACTYVARISFKKYNYVLVLRYPMDGHEIFELIDSMSSKHR